MANIFKSKEVYKHLATGTHEKESIVAVKGVYVTGEYRPPYYIDAGLHISGITTQSAVVKNYTTTSVTLPNDHILNILPIEVDTSIVPDVLSYTRAESTLPNDHILNILPIEVDTSIVPDILAYSSDKRDLPNDHILNILPIEVDETIDPVVIYFNKEYLNDQYDGSLRIRSISTTKATVSSVDKTSVTTTENNI